METGLKEIGDGMIAGIDAVIVLILSLCTKVWGSSTPIEVDFPGIVSLSFMFSHSKDSEIDLYEWNIDDRMKDVKNNNNEEN